MLVKFMNAQKSFLEKSLGVSDLDKGLKVSDDFIQNLLSNVLERNYMSNVAYADHFFSEDKKKYIEWLAVKRLPVPPGKIEEYTLLPRWQNALSTMHSLGNQLIYILLRKEGKTSLFLGAVPKDINFNKDDALDQLSQAVNSQMPGIGLENLDKTKAANDLYFPLAGLLSGGAVTGIPSSRKGINYGLFQTLDQVAFGVRDSEDIERDFAVVILADPVSEWEIARLISSLRNLGSEVHTLVQHSEQEGHSNSMGTHASINLGSGLGSIASMFLGGGIGAGMNNGGSTFMPVMNKAEGGGGHGGPGLSFGVSAGVTANVSVSESVSYQYLDKSAQYCEQLIDKHINRLNSGRSMGFWNTAVYVLGDQPSTVSTLMGMLRSVYSGDESYIEPIRSLSFTYESGACDFIKRFDFIPYPYNTERKVRDWHPFGSLFEYVSTPLNTEELSIATSLPRRDVPGLRFVRNSVRFAANPPLLKEEEFNINLGKVVDTGVKVGQDYVFSINSLVKHGLVSGITGSGKSTTCRRLMEKMTDSNIPFLIIEPAKDEYVQWAIEQNKILPENKKINIFMPGMKEYDGCPLMELKINPFQPAACKGAKSNLMTRLDRFKSVAIASLPMEDVLPVIFEEALYEHVICNLDEKYLLDEYIDDGTMKYPLISELPATAGVIIDCRGYEKDIRDNLKAAMRTRINSLIRGWRKNLFDVERSTDFELLFERRTVINLSRIADERDKSLIMALLFICVCEYRESKYMYDLEYRKKASKELCHLALIEEAHRLLTNIESGAGANPQAVVSKMFSQMLSEIRVYGQGMLIVDQVPSRLIPDAIKNTNLKITHRLVASDDRKALASCMALREEQEDIMAVLRPGEAIICSDYDDAATWVKVDVE